jgi:tRNA1Val (adenine37-N6)-methyltransferase
MKVGTDAVLLGAWANIEHAETILDCGAGSGVLALMAAQRNVKASITGIELDPNAANQASEN